jgi:hypothetical protein
MPLLGYGFLNATNFISRAALRGKLLNLHFRESAEAAAQNQSTTESKLESSRQRDSYPKTSGSIPLSVKGGQWSFVPHGVENIAIWVQRLRFYSERLQCWWALPSHVFQNNFSVILTPTTDSWERSLCFKFSSQKFA